MVRLEVDTSLGLHILCLQVRNKNTGSRGDCVLYYDRATGRYKDPREMMPAVQAGVEGSDGVAETAAEAAAVAEEQQGQGRGQRRDGVSREGASQHQQHRSLSSSASSSEELSLVNAESGPMTATDDPEALAEYDRQEEAKLAACTRGRKSSALDQTNDDEEANLAAAREQWDV